MKIVSEKKKEADKKRMNKKRARKQFDTYQIPNAYVPIKKKKFNMSPSKDS